MQSVNIICVGRLKEKFLVQAIEEYSGRLLPLCKFSITEVPEERVCNNPSPAQIAAAVEAEGRRILKKYAPAAYTAALCIEGELLSSEQFSLCLAEAAVRGFNNIQLIIGGSYGLSGDVKRSAQLRLSMGRMTFPHQLARVMVCEQVYRAFQIMNHAKYHK